MPSTSVPCVFNRHTVALRSVCLKGIRQVHCHIGKVEYLDHRNGSFAPGSIFTPYMYKRHAFSHERELRAVWFDRELAGKVNGPSPPPIHQEPVDLHDLIEKVIVRPGTADWARNIVKDITLKYGLNVKVDPSEIDSEPRLP